MSSTLERLESAEKTVAQLLAHVAKLEQETARLKGGLDQQGNNTMQYLQFTLQKLSALEQSLTSLAKMSYALTDELVGTGVATNRGIMSRIRRQDEEGEKKRVEDMVAAGSVSAQEVADASSLVTYSQVSVSGDTTETVAEFRALELAAEDLPENVRAAFVGKKVGETAEIANGDQNNIFTILAIYNLVTGERSGEAPAAEAAQGPTV